MDKTGDVHLKSEGDNDGSVSLKSSPAVDIPSKMYSTDSDLSDWEIRQFGQHKITSPPLIHKNHPSDYEENEPPGSPGKRSYDKTFDTVSFETAAENVQLSPHKKKHKEQVWTPGKENQGKMPKNWNNSVSSRDSALGSSLFSAFGSVLTDSSTSFDSQSNSDDTTSSVNSSPVHSVYGRYQKIYTNDKGKNTEDKVLREYENLLLHRLPGENLGMILGIEGGKFNETISGVFVKTVTIGGAAYRATGSSKGIAVGDEILEVNGMDLKEMNRDECMTVLKEMPLRVNLIVRRGSKFSGPTSPDGVSHFRQKMKEVSSREMKVCKDQRFMQNYALTTTASESEDDHLEGFALHRVEVDKNPEESLGISIVPSYGSTREFYQVKRLLPSGAAARSTKLRVGDRLVSCNGVSLRNLAQAKCLSILKTEAQHGDLELEVLRQAENDTPMEISVIVANGVGSKESKVSSSKEIYPNSGLESESENDVVLSGFHFNHSEGNSDSVNQVFAQNVKLQNRAPTKHPPQRHTSESNVSDQDSDYSLKSQHQKLVKAKMASNSSDPWSLALPPPAEFSDDAGLTSEAGDTGDEHVPTTNIDDILSDYAPSISGPASPRIEPVKRDLQPPDASSGFDRSQERKRVNSLTQIQESPQELEIDLSRQNGIDIKPSQVKLQTNSDRGLLEAPDKSMNNYGCDTLREQRQVMDVFDSYLTSEDDSIVSHKQSDPESLSHSNVCTQGIPQSTQRNPTSNQVLDGPLNNGDKAISSYQVTNVIHGDTKLGNNVIADSGDDEKIVPVKVKREMSAPPNWAKYSMSSDIPAAVFDLPESSVDEGVIIPATIQREKKTPIYDIPTSHLDTSPPREKIPQRPKPQPRKSKSSESEESMEETISPIHVKKEQSSKVLVEKIGTDIEETFIVPEKATRENSWSGVQFVLMANKWAKSPNSSDNKQNSGLLNVISNMKSDKNESNISTTEVSGVTVQSVNQVSVTPVHNGQRYLPVQGENVVNITVDRDQERQSSEEDSNVKEHIITPRIEEVADDNENVSLTVVTPDRGSLDMNQPTHKTIVCVSDDIKNTVGVDSDLNLPLAHANAVTLENVLMDTEVSENLPLIPSSVSESSTSPAVSPSVSPRSPVMESHDDMLLSRLPVQRSPEAKSPVPRSRKDVSPGRKSPSLSPRTVSPGRKFPSLSPRAVSPGRKSPSLSPRAVSPGVTSSVDPLKETELSTTKISVVKSPTVSPRSSVSALPPTVSSSAPHKSEKRDEIQAVKLQDASAESATKQPTKYTTSVAVTKPSLLSTIRSQKTTTPGHMKPLSTIKPLKINTNFQPKPVKYSTTINTKPSLLSTLHGSALSSTSTTEAKSSRSEDEPFQVNVLKGILGLGMKVKVTAEGYTQVTEVQSTGPIAKDKNIRTGDYILMINNTELTGLHDSKVQQILRLLPRGLAKIIASATPPSDNCSNPRGDSKELANTPEVLDVITTKSTQQVVPKVSPSPLIPVKPSGPKVTPRTVVTSSEPTKHVSSTSLGNQVANRIEPTISNKLQATIITNSHETAKPMVPKPAPREDIPKSTSREELPKPVPRADMSKSVPREEIPQPVSRADISKSVPREEMPQPVSRDDSPKSTIMEARVTSDSVVSKEPPPIAPKPRMDKLSKPDPIATARPSMGGYVGSAAGKVRTYERSSVTEMGSSYSTPSSHVTTKKNVSPTEKASKDVDPSEPIDTVIFTSISGPNLRTSPPRSGKDDQEPRLIPSGHVDYVLSAKPKSLNEPSSPRQSLSGPISPKLTSSTEKDVLKISPRKVNSALSPRKNKEPSQFNLFTKSSQIAAPAKKVPEFLQPTMPSQPGKNDETHSDTSAPDIDVVMPQSAHNVESSPTMSVEADFISVVNKAHVEHEINVVDVLHATTDCLPHVDKQEKQEVRDEISQELICTVAPVPEDSGEGKTWPMLDASVEVLHEDNTTKPILTDKSLPNNMKDDNFGQSDGVCEVASSDADSEDDSPPLPPQSTMPVALSIAKDMLDDLSDVGEEEPSQHLPAVPTTIAKEMLRDQELLIQHSQDLTKDSSEDKALLPPSVLPSLPPTIPPSLPPSIPPSFPPIDLLTESSVDDIDGVVPDSDRTSFCVVNEDSNNVNGQPSFVDLPNDVNTNAVSDGVSPANCMQESKDLLLSGVTPSSNACRDMVVDSQPQLHGSMLIDSNSVDSSYNSVFFQQDSPGFRGHPGDQNEKSSIHFSGNTVNDVEVDGNFVGIDVHKEPVNLSTLDNTLDSTDIVFCVDNAENQRKGDNSPFQDNFHDSFRVLKTSDDQLKLSYGHETAGSGNTDIKSPNSLNDFSDNDSLHVRSKRRWSVLTGPQELNVAYVKGSISSDATLDESIMSSENLAILLDSANDVMDQTGLSLDDEIVVIILHRHDAMLSIGVKLTIGEHQEAVVSSVDSNSLAGKDGRIISGDVLLSVNGESLTADKMEDVMDNLNNTTSSHVVLVVSKSDRLNTSEFVDTVNPCEQVVPNPEQEIQEALAPDEVGNVDQTESKLMDVINKSSVVNVIEPPSEVNDSTPPEVTTSPPPEVTTSPPPEVSTSPSVPVVPDVENSGVKVQPDRTSFQMPVFDDPIDDADKEEFDVVMSKGVTGLGFLIEGGKASPRGDMPLTIRRIIKNGPAEKCGQLKVKDEIREVNGEDITEMRHSEAWQHLKFLDEGEVRLKIWRRKAPQ